MTPHTHQPQVETAGDCYIAAAGILGADEEGFLAVKDKHEAKVMHMPSVAPKNSHMAPNSHMASNGLCWKSAFVWEFKETRIWL